MIHNTLFLSLSMHAIASKISPVPGSTGIQSFSWSLPRPSAAFEHFYCLQTPTGIKIMITVGGSNTTLQSTALAATSTSTNTTNPLASSSSLAGMLASGASAALAYAGSPLGVTGSGLGGTASSSSSSSSDQGSFAAVEPILRRIYEVYVDFALKNPFYTIDMPIRSEPFDRNLQSAISVNRK